MDRKKFIIDKLRIFKSELNRKVPVEKMFFFGSRVGGKPHRYSDIDLIIVSRKFSGKRFRYRPIGFYDYWNLDYPVDFLCYTPEEFKRLSKQITIVREAVKEGIEI